MSIEIQRINILNKIGKKIPIDIRFCTSEKSVLNSIKVEIKKMPLVVLFHGFKASKDYGCFPYICEKFAESGIISCIFNYSMNGVDENTYSFSSAEDFSANTVSQELEDSGQVLEWLKESAEFEEVRKLWNGELCFLGHSRGGGNAILLAEKYKPEKIILWASIATFDRYTERQKAVWREKGSIKLSASINSIPLEMNRTYIDDIEANKNRFDITKNIYKLNCKVLVLHGKEDLSVRFKEAESLRLTFEDAFKEKVANFEHRYFENTGHTFGTSHPFTRTTPALEEAIEKMISFLSSY